MTTPRHYRKAYTFAAQGLVAALKNQYEELERLKVPVNSSDFNNSRDDNVAEAFREAWSAISVVAEGLETEYCREHGLLEKNEEVYLCCSMGKCFTFFVSVRSDGQRFEACPHCAGLVDKSCTECRTETRSVAGRRQLEADRRDTKRRSELDARLAARRTEAASL